MTQPMNDPWAAAGVTAVAQPAQNAATQGGQGQEQSALAGAYATPPPPQAGPSRLFSQQSVAPSLFNKTHFVGTERVGVITKAPYDRQDQDFNTKRPKYFSRSRVGGETRDKAVTTDAIDGPTGQPNDPVMATHIEMSTEYRMTEQECSAVGRDPQFAQTDDGSRVLVIGGRDLKAFQEAIGRAIATGIPITKDDDLVGLRIRARRAGQAANPGGNPSWVMQYLIERSA